MLHNSRSGSRSIFPVSYWCERRDSNSHALASASPSSWLKTCAHVNRRASCKRILSRSVLTCTPATTVFAQIRTRPARRQRGPRLSARCSRYTAGIPGLPDMADTNLSSFIWSVADLLRGNYKQSDYGRVILPFTVLRRLDCVLEPTKAAVLAEGRRVDEDSPGGPDPHC